MHLLCKMKIPYTANMQFNQVRFNHTIVPVDSLGIGLTFSIQTCYTVDEV